MLAAVALGGWIAASAATGVAIFSRHELAERLEIVARASHELRGPITAARLGLQLAELSPARLRALDLELARAALALDDLTGAGDRSRPGGRYRHGRRSRHGAERAFDRVDVRQLLADSAEAWRPAAAERQVDLRTSWSGGGALVIGDRLRLAQATGNLIANAIEHGRGTVEVRGRRESAEVRLEVIDGGPGLRAPVAELTREARRRRGPRGRGLAIVAAVARDHGGHLAARPSERGARLVLMLPAARPAPESARRPG